MIDVHLPHKSEHTWTDFFLHIATIVVGLLIAIGLEQTVEHIEQGYTLARLASRFPDMPQLVTYDKIAALRPAPFDLDPFSLAAAHQRTIDLVNAATKETP